MHLASEVLLRCHHYEKRLESSLEEMGLDQLLLLVNACIGFTCVTFSETRFSHALLASLLLHSLMHVLMMA